MKNKHNNGIFVQFHYLFLKSLITSTLFLLLTPKQR